jgi:putative dimethyl sulfoxide reductase chaperone
VWTTRERLLYADCTDDVRRAFAEIGFTAPNPDHEPADHLANELAFLSTLLARTAAALDQGDEATAKRMFETAGAFFDNHPARWAPLCLGEVARRADTDFYRGAARLCAATLTALQGVLSGVA